MVEVVAAERHRETVVMVAVVCWSLLSSGVLRRGLSVSVQGPALALRRQGAGTRLVKFLAPALGIYRLVQHYRHAICSISRG